MCCYVIHQQWPLPPVVLLCTNQGYCEKNHCHSKTNRQHVAICCNGIHVAIATCYVLMFTTKILCEKCHMQAYRDKALGGGGGEGVAAPSPHKYMYEYYLQTVQARRYAPHSLVSHSRMHEFFDDRPRPSRLMKPWSKVTHQNRGHNDAQNFSVCEQINTPNWLKWFICLWHHQVCMFTPSPMHCTRGYTHSSGLHVPSYIALCTSSFLVTPLVHSPYGLKSPVDTQSLSQVFHTIISYGITTEATEETTATVN